MITPVTCAHVSTGAREGPHSEYLTALVNAIGAAKHEAAHLGEPHEVWWRPLPASGGVLFSVWPCRPGIDPSRGGTVERQPLLRLHPDGSSETLGDLP